MFGGFPFGGATYGDGLEAPPSVIIVLDLCDPATRSLMPTRTTQGLHLRTAASLMPTRTTAHHCED